MSCSLRIIQIPAPPPGIESIGIRSRIFSRDWVSSMNSSTTKKQSWLQRVPFHPLLFAAYPILALLAFNLSELNISAGVRSLFVSILLAVVLFFILRVIFHDVYR